MKEVNAAQILSVHNIAKDAMSSVNRRLDTLRGMSSSTTDNISMQGIRLRLKADSDVLSAINKTGALRWMNPSGAIFNNGWAIWSAGDITVGKTDNHADFNISSVSLGVDKRFTPHVAAGLSVRAGKDDTDIGASGTKDHLDSDFMSYSIYGSYALENDVFAQAAMGVSLIDASSRRLTSGSELLGNRDIDQYYVTTSLSKRFKFKSASILPYASLDTSYSRLSSYEETGSTEALYYHRQTNTSFAGKLGLKGHYTLQGDHHSLKTSFNFNYQQDLKSNSDMRVNYVDKPQYVYADTFQGSAKQSFLSGMGLAWGYKGLLTSLDYDHTQQVSWGHVNRVRLEIKAAL